MPAGRPTEYREEFANQAEKLCKLGATDKELADFFEVCEATINNWKQNQPGFLESLKRGKIQADAEVASKLFQRAIGYEHPETKFFVVKVDRDSEEIQTKETIKIYPPDATAALFWLKNRQPDKWRDKQEVETAPQQLTVTISGVEPPKGE